MKQTREPGKLSKELSALRKKTLHRRWQKAVTVMAALVLFCTVYTMILPAGAIGKDDDLEKAGIHTEASNEIEAPEAVDEEKDTPEEGSLQEGEDPDEEDGEEPQDGADSQANEDNGNNGESTDTVIEIVSGDEGDDGNDQGEPTNPEDPQNTGDEDGDDDPEVTESSAQAEEPTVAVPAETSAPTEGGEGEEPAEPAESTEASEDNAAVAGGGSGGGSGVVATEDGITVEDTKTEYFDKDGNLIGSDEEGKLILPEDGQIYDAAGNLVPLDEEGNPIVAEEEVPTEPVPEVVESVNVSKSQFFVGNLRYKKKDDYRISVAVPEEAEIPRGAKLKVRELEQSSDEYNEHLAKAEEQVLDGSNEIQFARFFDISIMVGDEKVEPAEGVNLDITITYANKLIVPDDGAKLAVHFRDEENIEVIEATGEPEVKIEAEDDDDVEVTTEVVNEEAKSASEISEELGYVAVNASGQTVDPEDVLNKKSSVDEDDLTMAEDEDEDDGMFVEDAFEGESDLYRFSFSQDSFSVVGTVITGSIGTRFIDSEGDTWEIVASFGPEAEIPYGATLEVAEITPDQLDYEQYYKEARVAAAAKAGKALTEEEAVAELYAKIENGEPIPARFFDITILDVDKNEVQPVGPVQVEIILDEENNMVIAEDADITTIHFGEEGTEVLESNANFLDAAEGAKLVDSVTFEAKNFSVYAILEGILVTEFTLPGSDETYEVNVTYGRDAKIPQNVHLEVAALAEDSEAYAKAKEAVIAAKKDKDEAFDESTLGFAALDISIVDNETGEKIEPADGAEVKVSFRMNVLPEGEAEDDLAETMEIQHLNESSGTPVVETVAKAVNVEDGKAMAEFMINSFSTFTITWSNATNTSTNLRWRYNNNNTRGQITVNYVNSEGIPITRPTGINGNYDISVTNGNFTNEVVFSTANVARDINGRTYESAYIVLDGEEATVTRVVAARTGTDSYSMSYYNDDTRVHYASGTGSTNYARPDVYLQYSSTPSDSYSAIVHYVDENGKELEIKNPEDTYPNMDPDSTSPAYLIYDIEGYEYSYTYRNTPENRIRAQLQRSGSTWQYRGTSSNSWSNLTNDDKIYVVYTPKVEPIPGGSPQVHTDETWPEGEGAPAFSKSSTNQGDGTNLISLSIKAAEQPVVQATPADVIVVFDNSYSMAYYNISGGTSGTRRLALAKDAVNEMADTLMGPQAENHDVQMAVVTFGTDAQVLQGFTKSYTDFSEKVNSITAPSSERTNWEKGLYIANTSTDLDLREDAATFVVFVTDGDPTVRMSRGDHTNAELVSLGMSDNYYNNSYLFGDGNLNEANYEACYEPAVPQVKSIVNSNKTFYAIGVSSDVSRLENLMSDAGQPEDNAFSCEDEDALKEAFASITEAIKSTLGFGDVQITDGITALTNMQMKVMQTVDENSFKYYRYGGDNNKYGDGEANKTEWTTREADGCAAATYNKDTGNVEWNMGSGFQLENGVTYVITFRVWPSQEAYDLIANLNNGTAVFSDLDKEIKDQVIELEAPDPENKIKGKYTLKTNTNTLSAKYKKTTKTGDVVSVSEDKEYDATEIPGKIEDMSLMSEIISIKKEWAHEFNESHAGDQVKFYLKVGDKGYYQNDGTVSDSTENADSLVLSNPDWNESIFIAPGMMDYADETVSILETGHEYELYEYEITQVGEAGNFTASYDFVSDIVRPMRVNGVLKYLVKYTEASEIPEGVTETYTIDESNYYVRSGSGDNGLLSGTNYRRAELDITKVINKGDSGMTEEQLNKEVFTYRVTLRIPADADLSLITGWQFVYRPDNPNWTIQGYQAEDVDEDGQPLPLEDDEERFAGHNFRWGTFTYNGTAIGDAVEDDTEPGYKRITMDLSMYPNQVVRLTNLPMGTEYTIEEVYANNRTLTSAGLMRDASVVPTTSIPSNLEAEGYTQVSSASKYGTANGRLISGTIDIPNRRYYNQFTNTIGNMAAADLQVTKHLEGYTWSGERYYFTLEAGVHKDVAGIEVGTSPLPASTSLYLSNPNGSEDRSYGFGSVKFNEEGTYTYTVKEARYRAGDSTTDVDIDQNADSIPDTDIVFEKPVTFTVTVSKDADGILYIEKAEGTNTELTGTVINTTFTNSQPCNVKILKVGDSTNPLSNVSFVVYSDSALTIPVTEDAKGEPIGNNGVITTDGEGSAALGAMLSGTTYYLDETDTHDGYNKLSKPVVITFDGTNVTASCEQLNVVYDSPEWIYKDDEGTWVVKINNSSGAVLPMTGGHGTLPYTLCGLLMVLGSALMLGFRKKSRITV